MRRSKYRNIVLFTALIAVLVTVIFWRSSRGSGTTRSSGTSFQQLVGSNGLFADPAALQANVQPSLYATAYDDQAVMELDPTASTTKTKLSASSLQIINSQVRSWGPLFAGLYLHMAEREFQNLPLPNVAAIRATLSPTGYFLQEVPKQELSIPIELASTNTALMVLSSNPGFQPTAWSSVKNWLVKIGPSVNQHPYLVMEVDSALSRLNTQDAEPAVSIAKNWIAIHGYRAIGTGVVPVSDVYDAFGAIKILNGRVSDLRSSSRKFLQELSQAALESRDPQVLWMGAYIAHALGARTIEQRYLKVINTQRVDLHLYASPSYVNGSLGTTLEVVTNPDFSSNPNQLGKIYISSLSYTKNAIAHDDQSACVVEAAVAVAINHPVVPTWVKNCSVTYLNHYAPTRLTSATAPTWISLGPYLASTNSGRTILQHLKVSPWSASSELSNAEIVRAAYIGLEDSAVVPSLEPAFAWTTMAAMNVLSRGPQSMGTLYYFEAASNLLRLGKSLPRKSLSTLRTTLARSRGCPKFPTLYRDSVTDPSSCSLAVTLVAQSLQATLMPGG